jgi:hypothetical protein
MGKEQNFMSDLLIKNARVLQVKTDSVDTLYQKPKSLSYTVSRALSDV